MPPVAWRVDVNHHPGSTQEEIRNEPDWGSLDSSNEHRIGYKNRQDRLPGLTHPDDELSGEDLEARKEYEELRKRVNKGDLINFRDCIENQKVLRARTHPRHTNLGSFVDPNNPYLHAQN